MARTAKLFMNGRSQAVWLPAEALAEGCPLVTADQAFVRVFGLEVLSWEEE